MLGGAKTVSRHHCFSAKSFAKQFFKLRSALSLEHRI